MNAARMAGVFFGMVLFSTATNAQNKPRYQELDEQALNLFKEEKYKDASKIWTYIRDKYSREEFRSMSSQDPRFIAWQTVFFGAIIRTGMAEKQEMIKKDPTKKANAETIESTALERAKSQMKTSKLSTKMQQLITDRARQPLLEILEKKDAK